MRLGERLRCGTVGVEQPASLLGDSMCVALLTATNMVQYSWLKISLVESTGNVTENWHVGGVAGKQDMDVSATQQFQFKIT